MLVEEEARRTAMTYVNSGNAVALHTILKDPVKAAQVQAFVSTQFGQVLLTPGSNQQDKGNQKVQ